MHGPSPVWERLGQLARRERRVGEIYESLALAFAARPSVAAFWREMAADEEIHALILGAIREALPPNARPPDVETWDRKVLEIDALVERVRSEVETGLSLEEALTRAEELERSELNRLTASVVRHAAREFSRVEFLIEDFQLERHREKVAAARARFVPPRSRLVESEDP